jgi:hypothetical protein
LPKTKTGRSCPEIKLKRPCPQNFRAFYPNRARARNRARAQNGRAPKSGACPKSGASPNRARAQNGRAPKSGACPNRARAQIGRVPKSNYNGRWVPLPKTKTGRSCPEIKLKRSCPQNFRAVSTVPYELGTQLVRGTWSPLYHHTKKKVGPQFEFRHQ